MVAATAIAGFVVVVAAVAAAAPAPAANRTTDGTAAAADSSSSSSSSTNRPSVPRVRVLVGVDSSRSTAEIVAAFFNAHSFSCSVLAAKELCSTSFKVPEYLVITNAPELPPCAVANYFAAARGGTHLVILGGRPPLLNLTVSEFDLNVLSPYEPYWMDRTRQVRSVSDNSTVYVGALQGLSALGFPRSNVSSFLPILEGLDSWNRSTGWALSAVAHTSGVYSPGVWLLSGIREPAFITNSGFLSVLLSAMRQVSDGSLIQRAQAWKTGWTTTVVPQPPPLRQRNSSGGRVQLSADGSRLLLPNGERLFAIGADYFRGGINMDVSPTQLRIDLTNAVNAGVNVMRIFGHNSISIDEASLQVFRDFNAKFGLWIIWTLGCFKDPLQHTMQGVVNSTYHTGLRLGREDWLIG